MFHLILHTALLILAAFVIGCILGCLLRRILTAGQKSHETSVTSEARPTPAPAVDVPAPAAAEDVAPVEGPAEMPASAVATDADEAAARLAVLPADASNEEKADAMGERPQGLAAARGGAKDDLKRIRGIGRVNEGKLNDLGIFHFDQIAGWSASHAAWVNTFLAFPGRIEREDWIAQAKILAEGGETEFARRVDKGEVATSRNDSSES